MSTSVDCGHKPACVPACMQPRLRRRSIRQEIHARGFDDFAQLTGAAEKGGVSTGIRLPALAGVAYLVLISAVDLMEGDQVLGYRQAIYIGQEVPTPAPEVAPPYYPEIRNVVTPGWRYNDGKTTWTITTEPIPGTGDTPEGPLDAQSFAFEDSDDSSLLYQKANIPVGAFAPSYLGLDAYTPPMMRGSAELRFEDLREPWTRPKLHSLKLQIRRPTRVRFYCQVLQTNPSTRFKPVLGAGASTYASGGLVPEESYTQLFTNTRYWSVWGSLVVRRAST